jgi:hypothetical protein
VLHAFALGVTEQVTGATMGVLRSVGRTFYDQLLAT